MPERRGRGFRPGGNNELNQDDMPNPVNLDELQDRLTQIYSRLPDLLLDAMDANALSAKAIIQDRIQSTGMNSSGVAFEEYTADYLAFKKAEGKYKGLVDFTFSTNMWSSIGIIEQTIAEDQVLVRVGGIDQDIKNQMNKLGKKRGNFMQLNEEEAGQIGNAIGEGFIEEVINLLNQ